MGKVYRALDKKLNEEVALKLIKPEIASDKETIERFSNELKLARKIGHRNVGRMYELLEAEGTHFITMEYVSGEDLKSFIHRARRPTPACPRLKTPRRAWRLLKKASPENLHFRFDDYWI